MSEAAGRREKRKECKLSLEEKFLEAWFGNPPSRSTSYRHRKILEAVFGRPVRKLSFEESQKKCDDLFAIAALTWQEREILRVRRVIPSITGGKVPASEEVARIFNVTCERVRQIETKAARKLRA